jgi:4-diphosphocytidyl-2-C-methyl-D-erythritol kinase
MASDGPAFEDHPPAKVNLTLEVIGRRPDGYHDLRSVFLRVGVSDSLTVELGGADGSDTLTVSGLGGVPVRDNLVLRAVHALRARLEIDFPALDITLEKRIPAAAGLGGGSSDCASALKVAQACWGIGLSPEDELALAAELGSDVPFFANGASAAIVEGRGERVRPIALMGEFGLLLVTPRIALSTPRVFDRYDELAEHDSTSVTDAVAAALEAGGLPDAGGLLVDGNDLWPAAVSLEPSLHALRGGLRDATGRAWAMSGSGPTMFAVYPSAAEAAEAGRALATRRDTFLEDALIHAVDLVGPDPIWRYP